MNDGVMSLDDDTLKFGLLMESAQAQQRLAETHLEKLRAHTQDLDCVVREEIRRTLIDELQALTAETERAAQALRSMKHAAHVNGLAWHVGVAVLCATIPGAVWHYLLPSRSQLAAIRLQRDALAENLARLERRGGKADWRICGNGARLCVRIDRDAPVYGGNADYYVVKGY